MHMTGGGYGGMGYLSERVLFISSFLSSFCTLPYSAFVFLMIDYQLLIGYLSPLVPLPGRGYGSKDAHQNIYIILSASVCHLL